MEVRMNANACLLPAAILTGALMPSLAAAADTADVTLVNASSIKWQDAPPSLPKGAKIAVLHGDPGKPGPFTMRLRAPAGYKIPPHTHSQTENLTVISGTLYLGMGDKVDRAQAKPLSAGGYHYLAAKTPHYAFTKAPTVVQVHGEGPFDINYLNAADNPDKSAK
jgi:quercetin dioxygenase-like cupin family protein